MSMARFRGATEWALMVVLVFGAGALAQAQNAEAAADEGSVIQIGQPDADRTVPGLPPPGEGAVNERPEAPAQLAAPRFWIGLLGGPIDADHPLRAHVDVPAGVGLLVANVVPDSPAAKAGLRTHDILLRANDTDLREMQDLVELVLTEGEKQGQIALEVLRRGDRETVYVTPEERPADAALPPVPPQPVVPGFGDRFGVFRDELPQDLLRQLPFEFRQFAPGELFDVPGRVAEIPEGISISILRDAGEPPRITVKRGEETWEIVGDDPEALAELPDDVRPFVERMLRNGSAIGFRPGQPRVPEIGDGRLRERLERMERRVQELQERLFGPNGAPVDHEAEQQR